MICDPTVEKPDLLKDRFWDEIIPQDLLYSVGSEGYGKVGRLGATASLRAPFVVSWEEIRRGSSVGSRPFPIELHHLANPEKILHTRDTESLNMCG